MALLDLIFVSSKNLIHDLEIPATLEEIYTDTLTITEHPVERGAAITDHAYRNPCEVVLKCGWTNSTSDAMKSLIRSVLGLDEVPGPQYVDGIYHNLRTLQMNREPISVQTSRRLYSDMLISSLQATTDQQTSNILLITATFKQILLVDTKATTLPAKEQQALAPTTSETQDKGVKQSVPGTPSTGGSRPVRRAQI